MDRRTKLIAAVFGALVFYGFVDRVIWPRWIDPLLSIDERVEVSQVRLARLQAEQDAVERAKDEYRTLAARVGSFDISRVKTDMLDRINTLIEKTKLESVNIVPGRPKEYSKKGLRSMVITVKATSTLESALEFLKGVSELPQLARIGNAAIYPVSRKRGARGKKRMNLRVPIEMLVLPRQKIVRINDDTKLPQPELFARHQDRDYSIIWDSTPFTEYVPPRPLRADGGPDVNVKVGKKRIKLQGKASGGIEPLACRWSPETWLSDPNVCQPKLDTSTPLNDNYELLVTDSEGKTARDTVRVVVNEPKKPTRVVDEPEPPLPTPRKVARRWKDRQYMQLRMTLMSGSGTESMDELAIHNNRAKRSDYYTIGDKFDGGELVYVHPTGAIVCRDNEYFIYSIGAWLDEDILVNGIDKSVALDYPLLYEVVDHLRRTAKVDKPGENGAAASDDTKDQEAAGQAEPAKIRRGGADREPPEVEKREAGRRNRSAKRTDADRKKRARRAGEERGGYPPLPEDIMERLRKQFGDRVDEAAEAARKKEEEDSTEDNP